MRGTPLKKLEDPAGQGRKFTSYGNIIVADWDWVQTKELDVPNNSFKSLI